MVDIKNIPAELKTSCRFCVWKFEKRNGQKTKIPYNPSNGDHAKTNDLRTFADFKTTLVTYAMGGYDGTVIFISRKIRCWWIGSAQKPEQRCGRVLIRKKHSRYRAR